MYNGIGSPTAQLTESAHQQNMAPSLTKTYMSEMSPSAKSVSSFAHLSHHRTLPEEAGKKPVSRVNSTGVTVGRVAPAIAQDTITAVGQINLDAHYRPVDDRASGFSTSLGQMGSATVNGNFLSGQRFSTTYEGHDPSIRQLLERTYLETYREILPEFGPTISGTALRRKLARASQALNQYDRPEGTLIAHLQEHIASISALAVSPDHVFFISASDDRTVKVWDSARLEKNVASRSRHTYQFDGPITALCILESSHCIAAACKEGSIKVFRVDVNLSGSLPRYGKQNLIRQYNFDRQGEYATAMLHHTNGEFGTPNSGCSCNEI